MANKRRLPLRKIKKVLRLKYDAELSYHQIAHGVNISTITVHDFINRFNSAGLTWQIARGYSDPRNLMCHNPVGG